MFFTVTDAASVLGCELKITKTMIETSTTLNGNGGSYYCLGGGPGKITFDASSLKTSIAKQSGGGFFMDVLDSIVFTVTPSSNLISCTSELG
jgi:hypothetical protein